MRAGRDSFVMCVNYTRPVNTVPVKRSGNVAAKKAGEASFVTKVCVPLSLGEKKHNKDTTLDEMLVI